MGSFDPVVGVSLHTMSYISEDGSYGSRVASQFVGNDPPWFSALAPQESSKESFCGVLITMPLDQDIDHVAVLIHGAPQILLLAVDSNEDLVQVPVIAESTLSSLQFRSVARTELPAPLPHRLIGDDNSPLGEKILDISEAQTEAMVRPDRIADDLGRKTITGVTRPIAFHGIKSFSFAAKWTMPAGVIEIGRAHV